MQPTADFIGVAIRLLVSANSILGVFSENMQSFMTDEGFDIMGHDMRVYRSTTTAECNQFCEANCGCLAFVRYHNGTCLLKTMSLDAGVVINPSAIVGFCIDRDNPERDYIYEHEWIGTNLIERNSTTLPDCADVCAGVVGALLYTWRADGTCTCKADFNRITKHFGYTSGFLTGQKGSVKGAV